MDFFRSCWCLGEKKPPAISGKSPTLYSSEIETKSHGVKYSSQVQLTDRLQDVSHESKPTEINEIVNIYKALPELNRALMVVGGKTYKTVNHHPYSDIHV